MIIYPAVTVGILFLLALCYCYLRSSARQRLLSEQQDDDDVRTPAVVMRAGGADRASMRRRFARSADEMQND